MLKHLNLCSCTSGATVCRFTIRLKAAWAVWPTFSLRKRRNWWKRERWRWNDKSPEHDIERVLKLMNVYSIMLEEDAGCSLNLTKGTSKLFFFFFFRMSSFLFVCCCFFSSPPPSISQTFEDTLSCLSIRYIRYILNFFLNHFLLSSSFQGDSTWGLLYVVIWLALSHQTHQKTNLIILLSI